MSDGEYFCATFLRGAFLVPSARQGTRELEIRNLHRWQLGSFAGHLRPVKMVQPIVFILWQRTLLGSVQGPFRM